LHTLEDITCRTEKCAHEPLLEFGVSFPTNYGLFDGTRAICWPYSLTQTLLLKQTQDIAAISHLVFRYGILIACTAKQLLTARWLDGKWKFNDPVSFNNSGPSVRSLIVNEGYAFVLSDTECIPIRLDNLKAYPAVTGRFFQQSSGGRQWAGLADDGTGQAVLHLNDCCTWQLKPIDLTVKANLVDTMLMGERILVATRDEHNPLLMVDPDSGEVKNWGAEEKDYRWNRLAMTRNRVLALGYNNDSRRNMLMRFTPAGDRDGFHWLPDHCVQDFVCGQKSVYLISEDGLHVVSWTQFSLQNEPMHLLGGQDPRPGMLLLYDSKGTERLLIRRTANKKHHLYLLNPDGGHQIPVTVTSHLPLVCLANGTLVVAAQDINGWSLRTFIFAEG